MESDLDRFGAAIADRYRLERELGRGGMATVYLAEDLRHRRSVALKVLDPRLAFAGADRFLHEIEIASRLMHPHILSLLDSGEAGGLLYYVMPYVPGDSLRARLRREGELSLDAALRVLRELLDALAYAHGQGIIHRDVKPENILFVGDHVQVADFGVAKALDAAGRDKGLTASGLAVGTPAYMAPEQALAKPEVDHRADIYAVGLVSYEMLSGVLPSGGSDPRRPKARQPVGFEPIDRVRPDVPAAVAAMVMRCLQEQPADRWQSCEEALRQLDLAASQSEGATALWSRDLQSATFRLTEEICRRVDRTSFDPRMIGDSLQYLDNHVPSDVLVLCFPACGLTAEQFAPFLIATRYRALSLTLFGFEAHRKRRSALPLWDHLVIAREWMRAMALQIRPRLAVAAGFSSGADFALRLTAAGNPAGESMKLDGCLSLGCNLDLETCFVTRVLSRLESGSEQETLAALRSVGAAAAALDDWINLHDYLIQIARKFRGGLGPLAPFARGIVEPFEAGPLLAFTRWYRDATSQGRRLRCVFDDNPVYGRWVRELHLRNLDEKILGDQYEEDSILIDPETGHFDLIEPARVEGHLDALVRRLRHGAGSSA